MSRTVTAAIPYTEMEVADGNYDESRVTIDRIIIHTMDGSAAAAAARFDNPSQQVSAHYGVKEDGSLIHWLEETFTAYHSGNYAMNQRSIGIEHEDNGDYNGIRPDALYATSSKLVVDICNYYGIPCDRQHILKHNEVIATGCPDALDIDRILQGAQQMLADGSTPGTPPLSVDYNAQWKLLLTYNNVWYQAQDVIRTVQDLQKRLGDEQTANGQKNTTIDNLNKQISTTESKLTIANTTIDTLTATNQEVTTQRDMYQKQAISLPDLEKQLAFLQDSQKSWNTKELDYQNQIKELQQYKPKNSILGVIYQSIMVLDNLLK